MKTYNNEITKKILTGFTALALMKFSYQTARAFTVTNNNDFQHRIESSISNQLNDYKTFNKFYDSVLKKILVASESKIYLSDIDFSRYGLYNPNYDIGLKVLVYFANYDYIVNTELEEKLREEKIVDTYSIINSFGLDLDLDVANDTLNSFLLYNHKIFADFEYNEDEFILSRKLKTDNLSSLLNPSLFLNNENDKKFVDLQFKSLVELIEYCKANDKNKIEESLTKYFNCQANYPNITSSTKWLNSATNNAMCIKIIETYLIQNDELKDIFTDTSFTNLYFKDGYVEDEQEYYHVDDIEFSKITDPHFKLLLEYDRNLHFQVYCNKNVELTNSIKKNISTNSIKKLSHKSV